MEERLGVYEKIAAQLSTLADLGIRTHVDDIGTGYSSLALLQRLSLNVLKIDRAFTAGLGTTAESEVFYRAIVSMAHALGMRAVAERVETATQVEILRTLDCDEIQGFVISKSVPAADAVWFLLRPNWTTRRGPTNREMTNALT